MRNILWITLLAVACNKGGTQGGGGSGSASTAEAASLQQTLYDTSGVTPTVEAQLTFNYQYNNNGQETYALESVSENLGGNTPSDFLDTVTITYTPTLVTLTGLSEVGTTLVDVQILYYLNSGGTEIDSSVTKETAGGTVESPAEGKYSYNNGLVSEIDSYSKEVLTGKTIYSYSGNDVTTVETQGPAGQVYRIDTYTYGAGTGNFDLNSISFSPILLHQAVDLPKSMSSLIDGVTTVVNFTYTFDSQKRISGITATSGSGKLYEQDYNVVY